MRQTVPVMIDKLRIANYDFKSSGAERAVSKMKRLITFLLLLCFTASLTGCVGGESARLKEGRKLIKEYLAARGGSAVLTESYAEVLRPDAGKLVLSDYVKGSFREGDESYHIAVNVVTGKIYSSERLPEFREYCIRALEKRLGLERADCVGNCSVVELYAAPWQEESEEWPWERSYLGPVLPVDVQDLADYADRAISDEDIRLVVDFVCRNTEPDPARWMETGLSDWQSTVVTLMVLPEHDAALPLPEELTVEYRNGFPGVKLTLSERGIE